jgi:hypothetical protein
MVEAFPGERRAILTEMPYLSAYGWSAVVLDDKDLRGVYVLGEPELLSAHMAQQSDGQAAEQGGGRLAAVRGRLSSWGRRLRRRDKTSETADGTPDPIKGTPDSINGTPDPVNGTPDPVNGTPESVDRTPVVPAAPQQDVAVTEAIEIPDPAQPAEGEQKRRFALRRWMGRARDALRRRRGGHKAGDQAKKEDAAEPVEETVYLFAYIPDPAPLRDEDGRPQLPPSLIPLCRLHYTRQVRPETLDTLRAVAETGIALKVFTPGAADRDVALFRQAGIEWTDDASQHVVSGPELDRLETDELAARVL